MSWTEERVELLRKLWGEQFSASMIAAELGGVSRSAVLGKIHRLGLGDRGPAVTSVKRQCNRHPATSERRPYSRMSIGNTALKAEPDRLPENRPQPFESVVVPIAKRLTIDKLTERTCKWPIGHPGEHDFHFCGHDSFEAMPYCRYHARLAYRPGKGASAGAGAHQRRCS